MKTNVSLCAGIESTTILTPLLTGGAIRKVLHQNRICKTAMEGFATPKPRCGAQLERMNII